VSRLNGFRRLHRRYARKAPHFLAFTGLAAASSATAAYPNDHVRARAVWWRMISASGNSKREADVAGLCDAHLTARRTPHQVTRRLTTQW
jgi:hypothetical protein